MQTAHRIGWLLALLALSCGYFGTMEKIGQEKRDILVKRVGKARDARRNRDRMLDAMRNAESKIEPVLSVFRDQVFYLKHNLSAKALAALQDESVRIETDVNALLRDLSTAIAEADRFIQTMAD